MDNLREKEKETKERIIVDLILLIISTILFLMGIIR